MPRALARRALGGWRALEGGGAGGRRAGGRRASPSCLGLACPGLVVLEDARAQSRPALPGVALRRLQLLQGEHVLGGGSGKQGGGGGRDGSRWLGEGQGAFKVCGLDEAQGAERGCGIV